MLDDHSEKRTDSVLNDVQEFIIYFQYVRSLRFDEKPDYAFLRRMFRDLFAKEGGSEYRPPDPCVSPASFFL